MSEKVQDEWAGFEITSIASGGRWFDIIEKVLYENKGPSSIRIGLGHTQRKVVHIVIGDATEEDEQQLKIKAMEGEVLSDG
jgi:hypothetical protein